MQFTSYFINFALFQQRDYFMKFGFLIIPLVRFFFIRISPFHPRFQFILLLLDESDVMVISKQLPLPLFRSWEWCVAFETSFARYYLRYFSSLN